MKFSKHKLGELLRVTRGTSLPGTGYADEGRYLRLTLANFHEEGGFKDFKSTQGKYFVEAFDNRFLMHKGDLITPLTEQSPGLLGSVAFIPCDDLYIQSQDVGLITCNTEKLDKTFAYYLFLTRSVREQISARSQQTKIRHTSPDKISDVEVYLPDLPTKLRIAGVLGSIDEKIELNRRKIAELEALAKTIYDYWFVQFDFPDANGRPYKSSGGKMVWNEQLKREVPGGWEVRPLSTFSERITKGTTPTSIGCSFTNKGVRFIKVENIMNGTIEVDNTSNYISEQTDSKMARSRLCESDLLITIAGRLGDVAIVPKRILPANTNQAVGIVRLNQDSLPIVHYLSMYLSTVQMKTRLQTMNAQSIQKNLNLENVGQIDILCEYAVMSKFENYIRPIRENLECLHEEIETLTMQRDELLPLLMNGQVKVG